MEFTDGFILNGFILNGFIRSVAKVSAALDEENLGKG
jgi:hypothetical protein